MGKEMSAEIPPTPNDLALKDAVRELRKTLGLSQQKFGVAVGDGVTVATAARWEAGTSRPHPGSLSRLYRMARENNRDDLAGVFLRGGAPPATKGPSVAHRLSSILEFVGAAQSYFWKADLDPQLNHEQRTDLRHAGLKQLEECKKFTESLIADSGNEYGILTDRASYRESSRLAAVSS